MSATSFISITPEERAAMLRAVGAKDIEDLFAEIPPDLQTDAFDLPPGRSELEVMEIVRGLAAKNAAGLISFCGAGFYDHFIPAAVDALASRGEFLTAYTPYQAEASQGTLQAIYEYQTAVARLTEMDAANASLYDGGTALFEAVRMAQRITGRSRVLVDAGVNPIYRAMLRAYLAGTPGACEEIPWADGLPDRAAFTQRLNADTAAIVLQYPNFLGLVDDYSDLAAAAHAAGALVLISTYPIALGILKTPGAMGADIVTGEGQSLGLPLSFGGPYLGFMAVREAHARKMPGRLAGATRDAHGRRGFVLTLQAREQHIRRERATSNICTNEAWCALRALIYLALLGKQGFVELSRLCAARAAYARERLTAIAGVRPLFDRPYFNELALSLPRDAAEVVDVLRDEGLLAGVPLGSYYPGLERGLLVAVTEKRTRAEIDRLADRLEAVLRSSSS